MRQHSPTRRSAAEALLLPERSLALVDEAWSLPEMQSLVPALPPTPQQEEARRLAGQMLSAAFDLLRRAKTLHDELEAIYRPYMDFEALTAYTDHYIAQLFS